MLDNYELALTIKKAGKRLVLRPVYPSDDLVDKSVLLEIPFENGTLVTKREVIQLIKNNMPSGDVSVDLSNVVTIDNDQTIKGIKIFAGGLKSEVEPKDDTDVIRKQDIDAVVTSIKNIIDSKIGDLSSVDIEVEGDKSVSNLFKVLLDKIKNTGTGVYNNPEPTPITLGGVERGTTFDNVPISDIITMLLYPYQKPSITQLSTPKTTYNLGESTGSELNVTWATTEHKNIKDGSIVIKFNNVTLLDGPDVPKSGNKIFTITPVALNTPGGVNLTMTMRDIKGNNLNRSLRLEWIASMYYGAIAKEDITPEDISKLKSKATKSYNGDYNIQEAGYKYIVYPRIWGEIHNSVDPNTNFKVPLLKRANINITNNFGATTECFVYRSHELLNGPITIRLS